MIRTRFGSEVSAVRFATLKDVADFDGGDPDLETWEAVRSQSWVVITRAIDGKEMLVHIAQLTADNGRGEVVNAAREGATREAARAGAT